MQIKTRLIHIEYLGIIRDLISILLKNDDEISLVHQGTDCNSLLQLLKQQDIDILLLGNNDTRKELFNYANLCRDIRTQFPDIKIIVHSIFTNSNTIVQTMNAGADAFVSNDMGCDDLIAAINSVKKGHRYLSKQIGSSCKNAFEFLAGFADKLIQKTGIFTSRELEVLGLVARGCTNKQIADALSISLKTVETHRKHLITKARVKNTAQLIAYSGSYGFL